MNIYDIAEEAGVSISTVSRVLNNKSNVNVRTREKVEAVLKKHNYTPSSIARGLVTRSLNTIGILTIDIRIPHYAAIAYILERELYKLGYNAFICNTGGTAENGIDYIHMLMKKGVSGIMLVGSVFQNKYIETSIINDSSDIPCIVINAELNTENSYSILINHEHGISLCLEHLRQKGHKNILFVQDYDNFSGQKKTAAFVKLQKKAGVGNCEQCVFKSNKGIVGGKEVIDSILKSKVPFSAIIFGNDHIAIEGMQYLNKLGYKVPEDVAIIGLSNSLNATTCIPPLTTVDNQDDTLGTISVKILDNLLNNVECSHNITINPVLIVREST
jgi:LacI family transcriptional regulator